MGTSDLTEAASLSVTPGPVVFGFWVFFGFGGGVDGAKKKKKRKR